MQNPFRGPNPLISQSGPSRVFICVLLLFLSLTFLVSFLPLSALAEHGQRLVFALLTDLSFEAGPSLACAVWAWLAGGDRVGR